MEAKGTESEAQTGGRGILTRSLPALLAGLILLAAWFIPEAAPAHLSALQAYELLELPAGPEPAEGEVDTRLPLWEVVLQSPATRITEDGKLQLLLHGVLHRSGAEDGGDVGRDPWAARQSLVRGMRELVAKAARDGDTLAAHPEYADFVISGAESPQSDWGANFDVQLNGKLHSVGFHVDHEDGVGTITASRHWSPPDRTSVVPPLVAVLVAILFRRPLLALFLAVFAGAAMLRAGEGSAWLAAASSGFLDVGQKYFWAQASDQGRIYIIGFVFFMLAMVGVMTRSGGIRGLMDAVARLASDARRTQVAAWLMGLVIFFDDYANTILVGSTMRPLTDRFKIAREKLAYIVDSTAAPVAGLSIFSTWIAFEVSTFNGQLPAAGMSVTQGYEVFLGTIPYSFYCFLTIWFVGLVAITGRDFGPMLTAERRARSTGALLRPGATPMVSEEVTSMEAASGVKPNLWLAVLPLVAFMAVTLFTILKDGGIFEIPFQELMTLPGITQVLYDGSGEYPLLAGALAGFLTAALGAFRAGLRSDILSSALKTVRAMWVGFAILYLAWMIGAVCGDLGTAPFLTALAADALDPDFLPTLLFLLAGGVAFATGSSWSTMSILLPLTVGLAYQLGTVAELAPTAIESGRLLMTISIGAVLSGAIFGDHCSPISDTTVMSSIACASDHIDHVRTQIPYAVTTMLASILCGYFPVTYYGLSPWIGLLLGAVLLLVILMVFGRRSDTARP